MNLPSAQRAQAAIGRRGHLISLRRGMGDGAQRADVKAIVWGYSPDQLTPGITVGTRRLIVSRLDLEAAGFPVPPDKGDWIHLGEAFGIPTHVDAVDVDHREHQGCYDVTVKGN